MLALVAHRAQQPEAERAASAALSAMEVNQIVWESDGADQSAVGAQD
jgi:hypothetical protein